MENTEPKKRRSSSIPGLLVVVFVLVLILGAWSGNEWIKLSSIPVALAAVVSMFLFGDHAPNKVRHALVFGGVCIAAWAVGTFLLAYYSPHLVYKRFKRAIVDQGFGEGPVPVNTLYTESQALFADPLNTSLPPGSSRLMTVGVNHDTLLVVGVLDLSKGPQVLHVPDFPGRYYSVQFTDPSNADFAYVGTRETGTAASDHVITGPGWKAQMPSGMKQIAAPNNSVLVIGRVLVYSDDDLSTAYGLAKQIQFKPLSQER